ncbi:hypothetical protein CDL12_26383 [Handroanthus impetiginosus]|uniref:F-box associated beta-propeller type 1 domain-containing protein n=1 Tax=Handroanthus impetiginosus TaxID=429701 RepID=A0A2G9G727_9LAMI|nr:hypothetical protein CDL12_26383 [Handroanthus impetiginosus]
MVLQCYTWIIHLIKQIIGDDDDAIARDENLTRLSVQVALQCQKISKVLQISTSSSHRILYQRRERPLILRCCSKEYPRLYVISDKSEKECKVRGLKELKYGSFVGCCNELALFCAYTHLSQYFVFDPLSKERTTTIYPPTWKGYQTSCGIPCGFFFHPLEKEHRILFVRKKSENLYEYHLYLFGAKMWRKAATPHLNCQPSHAWDPKRVNDKPAIVNGRLHWYTGKIMIFDMVSEEFYVKPIPLKTCGREMAYTLPDLLVKEDHLCLCHVSGYEQVMDIWILEDYDKWSWVRRYTVNLAWDVNKYPLKANAPCSHFVTVVSIHKDELVLLWRYRGMFSYDLVSKSVERINLTKSEMDDYDCNDHNVYLSFAVYKGTTSD